MVILFVQFSVKQRAVVVFFQDLVSTDPPLLLISTLDGTLHAVNKRTGTVKWKLDEDPVLNVPMESSTTIKG